jgi:hypothetical protein
VRFDQQIARDPTLTVSSSSSTSTSMPRSARSIAAVSPTGPAPATITGQWCGEPATSVGFA